ncbi:MAG: hypothetical protein V3R84_03950 [Acidimicrobiia bacterium]
MVKAEHSEFSKKVPHRRTAVSNIRARLIELAESTQNELGVVDGMIDLASNEAVPAIAKGATQDDSKPVAEATPPKQVPQAQPTAGQTAAKNESKAAKSKPKADESPATKVSAEAPEQTAAPASKVADAKDLDESVFDPTSLMALASDLDDAVPGDESKESFYGSGLRRRLTEGTKTKKGR